MISWTTTRMTSMIEGVWDDLRRGGETSQRRVDESHPHDLYADFEQPDQVGMVIVCSERPTDFRPMRAIAVEIGQRADSRWALRLALLQPLLLPVFAAFCRDIISFTREGTSDADLGDAILSRLNRWRSLLEREAAGLSDSVLRGLIGELTVLESRLCSILPIGAAVAAWRGPVGGAQDFLLPSGDLIEVKTADRDAQSVLINGLAQLSGDGALTLAVVRVQVTGAGATGAVTAPMLVQRMRACLLDDPDAAQRFEAGLATLGWHEHPAHDDLAVRVLHIEAFVVDAAFPRLTTTTVPSGIDDVTYSVNLAGLPFDTWSVS
jgi:hypothetical protein